MSQTKETSSNFLIAQNLELRQQRADLSAMLAEKDVRLEELRKTRDNLRDLCLEQSNKLTQNQAALDVAVGALESVRYQSQFWDLGTTREKLRLQLGLCTVASSKALSHPTIAARVAENEGVEKVVGAARKIHDSMWDGGAE